MNCRACEKASGSFHKKCFRCVSCWNAKLYRPESCTTCKDNFKKANESHHSEEREKARGNHISWLKALVAHRQRHPGYAGTRGIWASETSRSDFTAEWCELQADYEIGEPLGGKRSSSRDSEKSTNKRQKFSDTEEGELSRPGSSVSNYSHNSEKIMPQSFSNPRDPLGLMESPPHLKSPAEDAELKEKLLNLLENPENEKNEDIKNMLQNVISQNQQIIENYNNENAQEEYENESEGYGDDNYEDDYDDGQYQEEGHYEDEFNEDSLDHQKKKEDEGESDNKDTEVNSEETKPKDPIRMEEIVPLAVKQICKDFNIDEFGILPPISTDSSSVLHSSSLATSSTNLTNQTIYSSAGVSSTVGQGNYPSSNQFPLNFVNLQDQGTFLQPMGPNLPHSFPHPVTFSSNQNFVAQNVNSLPNFSSSQNYSSFPNSQVIMSNYSSTQGIPSTSSQVAPNATNVQNHGMFITPQTSQGPSTEAVPSNSTNEANQTSTGESVSEIWFVIPQGASLSKEDQTITINEGTIPRDQISIKNLDGRSLWKPAKYGNSLVDKLSALSLPFRPERKPKVQKKSLTTMLSAPILAKCIPVDSAWEVNEDSKFSCNLPDNIKEILKFKKDDKNKDIKTKEINLSFIGKDEESKNFFECMNEKKLDAETTKLKGPLEGKSIPMSESALKKDKILRDRLNKAVSASTVLDLAKEMLSSKNLIKLELSNSAHCYLNMVHNVIDTGLQMSEPVTQLLANDFNTYREDCRKQILRPIKTESVKEVLTSSTSIQKGIWSEESKEQAKVTARQAIVDGTLQTSGSQKENQNNAQSLGKLVEMAISSINLKAQVFAPHKFRGTHRGRGNGSFRAFRGTGGRNRGGFRGGLNNRGSLNRGGFNNRGSFNNRGGFNNKGGFNGRGKFNNRGGHKRGSFNNGGRYHSRGGRGGRGKAGKRGTSETGRLAIGFSEGGKEDKKGF